MIQKLNLTNKYFYSLLTIIVATSSLFINTSSSQAHHINQQNNQSQMADESNSDRGVTVTSNNVATYNSRVLPETINLVKKYEGFRSYAYIDSSGLPVIGYGQTRINGRTVRMGQYITRAQADLALAEELDRIQRLVLTNVKVPLTPHQLGALTSLVYNAGTVVVKNSTLVRKLNARDYQGAAREFVRWNKANQGGRLVVFPGLTKRRVAEQNLFLTPYSSISSN